MTELSSSPAVNAKKTIILHNFTLIQPALCTEEELFFRRRGPVALDAESNTLRLDPGGTVLFDTYFNMFSAGKWLKNCDIRNLRLIVEADGAFEASVIHSKPGRSWDTRSRTAEGTVEFDLSGIDATGMLALKLVADKQTVYRGARFVADLPGDRELPRLAISMTTYKREAAAAATIRRLLSFRKEFEFRDNLLLQVVDNGNSLKVEPADGLRYFANKNLGGAGGFARGLLEAETAGHTHVLFTDDDADFMTESLARTFAFLALAKDSRTAIIGAMINNQQKWALWESGALFDHKCIPQFAGKDLRLADEVRRLEHESQNMPADRLYGGWWYFAFPVAHARYKPFPFFVRGDDVSFSIVNDFHQLTLAGVASFQDSFTYKESPTTWYLDFRSHMVHHLAIPSMESSVDKLAGMFDWFLRRTLQNFHYERTETVLLAMQHVLEGPDFFAANPDAAQIRGEIKQRVVDEVLKPMAPPTPKKPGPLRRFRYGRLLSRRLGNGQRIPFFEKLGGEAVIDVVNRHHTGPVWGNSRLTYYDSRTGTGYSVKFDREREKALRQKAADLREAFRKNYSDLVRQYQAAYPAMASRQFWERAF